MIKRLTFIVGFGLLYFSCGTPKERSDVKDEIPGTYVRVYSFKVINPETGNEIGISKVRDTVFVHRVGDEYEVSNNKWKLNDFDKEGWQSMEHSNDHPFSKYIAHFDNMHNALIANDYLSLTLSFKSRTGKTELILGKNVFNKVQ